MKSSTGNILAMCVAAIGLFSSLTLLAQRGEREASKNAFLKAYPVFMSPRCVNCHPNGDVPMQGENGRPHLPRVIRGADGEGVFALKCANCHQAGNLPGLHMPPGNPHWKMPPAEFPMVFEGRTPAELAKQLLEPNQNNNRTKEEILHHVQADALVLGCWIENSNGRPLPPITHQEFVNAMREWGENGYVIPD